VIARIGKWGPGTLIGFAAAVCLVASLITIGGSTLLLEKSARLNDGGTTVFVSFVGHPECGAVLEFVNAEDLEAGDVVSGDSAPCEARNLIIRVLQSIIVIALIGALLFVVWIWLGARGEDEEAPGPA